LHSSNCAIVERTEKELEKMADGTRNGDFLAGFLIGALVGAAAALLLAPHSGEETRILIRDKGIELKDQAGEVQTRLMEAVEEGKSAATTRKEELLARIDRAQHTGEPEVK
jgi:gas vesicle protein